MTARGVDVPSGYAGEIWLPLALHFAGMAMLKLVRGEHYCSVAGGDKEAEELQVHKIISKAKGGVKMESSLDSGDCTKDNCLSNIQTRTITPFFQRHQESDANFS